jgi:hypothetical protein
MRSSAEMRRDFLNHIRAGREISIERDDDCGGQIRVRAADEKGGQPAVTVIDDPMFAVGGTAGECGWEHADRAGASERLWRGRDENGAWIEMCQPDDRRAVRQARLTRERVSRPRRFSVAGYMFRSGQRRSRCPLDCMSKSLLREAVEQAVAAGRDEIGLAAAARHVGRVP